MFGFKTPSIVTPGKASPPSLIKKDIPTTWKKWNDESLQVWRYRSDPLADQIIQEININKRSKVVHEFLISRQTNSSLNSPDLDPILRDYVQKIILPSWADKEKLAKAELTYDRFAIGVNSLLHWYSLPLTYCCENGAVVLHETGELTDLTKPRILKTARLIRSVLSEKSFQPNGKAIVNIAKVRLVHALVRYSILHPDVKLSIPYDPAIRGLPINQEDMVGTMLTFSVAIIDGLKRLGANLTTEEEESYLHLWNVTGHMMGVEEELLPKNVDEGNGMSYAIMKHQRNESGFGKSLIKALINYLKEVTPGEFGDHFHCTMIRFCIGDELANELAVPDADKTRYLIPLIRAALSYVDHLDPKSHKSESISLFQRRLLGFLFKLFAQGNTLDYDEGKLKNEHQ